jgi:transcription elongation factor Elf1
MKETYTCPNCAGAMESVSWSVDRAIVGCKQCGYRSVAGDIKTDSIHEFLKK